MRICIVRVGEVDEEILEFIRRGVEDTFDINGCLILNEKIPLPKEAYNRLRGQYVSDMLLNEVLKRAIELNYKTGARSIVLGVTNADIYAPQMNFIFGEAQCPGVAAIISLFRLRPEFYGEKPDKNLLVERTVKEAIHELGHTFGLGHCRNPLCVMFFSSHVGITDKKLQKFCEDCKRKIWYAVRQ